MKLFKYIKDKREDIIDAIAYIALGIVFAAVIFYCVGLA